VFDFLRRKPRAGSITKPRVDLHSHLIPGLDDGVSTLEEALEILLRFEQAGYKKIITTPHVMGDFYKNTSTSIKSGLKELQDFARGKTDLIIEAAAEYYLDEGFMEILSGKDEVLTIGSKNVLFETSFMAEPVYLREAIFKMQSLGLKPILAHPERYIYLHENPQLMKDLFERGVHFQININSLIGYYSKPVQKQAQKMINSGMFHYLGSDCHNMMHLDATFEAMNHRLFYKAMEHKVLNDKLLPT